MSPAERTNELGVTPAQLRIWLVPNGHRTLAMTAFLFGLTLALGYLAAHASPWIAWPLRILAGFVANGLVQLAHEAWHGNLFVARWKNEAFGHFFSLMSFVPFRSARHAHLLHHRHNRTEKDPDAYNVGARSVLVWVQFYLIVFAGLLLSPLYFGLVYPAVFMRGRALAEHVLEMLINLALWSMAYWLLPSAWLEFAFTVWLLPMICASPWNGLKSITDHYANAWKSDRFHTATTVHTTRLWTWLWSGLNHHLDHHLYPRIPGHHLPALHAQIGNALVARNAPVFKGYLTTMARAFLAGPTYVEGPSGFLRRAE